MPKPTIYNPHPQAGLQFGMGNAPYLKSITISGHHALIDTIDGFQLWNLSLQPTGQIPLPDCTPYTNIHMNTHVGHRRKFWLLDTNKTSNLLIAFFTGSGPSAEANFVLVFTGFNSPKFLHRLLLPQHEHFDAYSLQPFHHNVGARLIVTKGVARTALLISCRSNHFFICDLQNEVEYIHYNPELTNGADHVSTHFKMTAPYHLLPSFDNRFFCIHGIPKWNIFKISFDGNTFLVSLMEVNPPNEDQIPDKSPANCICFIGCSGGLVGVTDTRVLWKLNFSAMCLGRRHHYHYLIEQDFLKYKCHF